MEPYTLPLRYWLLIDTGREGITVFSCLPHQAPTESSTLIATQPWLVLVGHKTKLTDMNVAEICGEGGG